MFALPNVLPKMNTADFFIKNNDSSLDFCLSQEEVREINIRLRRQLEGIVINLSLYELKNSGLICAYSLQHAALRDKPQKEPQYRDIANFFDTLQLCTINPGEALLILAQTPEKSWYFVQTEYARGWIESSAISAAQSRTEWHDYCNHPHILYVLEDCELDSTGEQHYYQMGAKLRIDTNSELLLPQNGQIHSFPISDNSHLSSKPVCCSGQALIRQAFKYYHTPYCWGGVGGVDCSGLVANVYRSSGILLPQNTWEQVNCPFKRQAFSTSQSKNIALLQQIPRGALLWFKGHIMLFLGCYRQIPYVIHALSRYRDPQTGELIWNKNILVSDLSIQRENGTALLEILEYACWPQVN